MPEKIDILIKNGSVIEPDKKTICKKDIAIRDGYVVDYDKTINYEIKDEINAEGYYVSPGWVDSHVHIFKEGTEPGFDADLNLIPMGITAAIDGGSSGAGNWPVFKRTVVDNSYLNIFYSVNVSTSGQITESYPENVDPNHFDEVAVRHIFESDPEHARGLKLRYGAEVVEPFGEIS